MKNNHITIFIGAVYIYLYLLLKLDAVYLNHRTIHFF